MLLITAILIPVQWLAVVLEWPSRRRIPILYHRMLCGLLGIRIRVIGAPSSHRPLLIVANHVSWLDIPVIAAMAPVVFVAKTEVASWPVIGLLSRLQRSIFVNRRRRLMTDEVNARIRARLGSGDPVVLFAEGTSSDGNRVLPFRTALIGAARDTLTAAENLGPILIQPLSIAYVGIAGLPMGRRERPIAAWYGDMDLLPHLVEVLRHGSLEVVLTWGTTTSFGPDGDRKEVAGMLERHVRAMTVAALRQAPAPHSFRRRKTL